MLASALELDRKAMDAYFASLGIPGRQRRATRDGANAEHWVKASVPFFRRKSLYLWGNVGVGKSCLAGVLMMEGLMPWIGRMQERGYAIGNLPINGRWGYVPEMLAEIEASNNFRSSTCKKELIERFASMPLVVIDDIGTEESTARVIETLTSIIDIRNREERHTIFTSNLSMEALAHKLGSRIASRIVELCDYGRGVIELVGPNRRLTGGEE